MGGPLIQVIFPPVDLAVAYGRAADRVSDFVRLDVTQGLATQIAQLVIDRTRSGRDVRNSAFADYAVSTQRGKKVGPQPVTLTGPGRWLDMLMGKVDSSGDAIVIAFDDTEAEAIFTFHQVGTSRGMPSREWLGLTPEEEQFVFLAMQRLIETQTIPDACMLTGLPAS